ncbi:DUF2732 family protein [Edwardsiella tarda]|uniref:DUF2732 family protein n=1 Tax=Edwardsiella tarda TaxID=636 RepID=UPI00063BE482|nr:DUF2732 family protein [Edwardsiella tarda]AKH88176.1 DUF2732 domain-containing protein [Edwardsiella tarda]
MKKEFEMPSTSARSALTRMLAEVRTDERRNRAVVMAARLERIANHIQSERLSAVDAAELLRGECEYYQNQAQELH